MGVYSDSTFLDREMDGVGRQGAGWIEKKESVDFVTAIGVGAWDFWVKPFTIHARH